MMASYGLGIESRPTITNQQLQVAAPAQQSYAHGCGRCMLGNVSQSFLRDPVKGTRDILRDFRRHSRRRELDSNPGSPGKLAAIGAQCDRQSKVVERRRMESVRDPPQIVRQLAGAIANLQQPAL